MESEATRVTIAAHKSDTYNTRLSSSGNDLASSPTLSRSTQFRDLRRRDSCEDREGRRPFGTNTSGSLKNAANHDCEMRDKRNSWAHEGEKNTKSNGGSRQD